MAPAFADAFEEHFDGDLVGDEFAARHVLAGELAEFGVVADVLAEHVAGGDVDEPGGRSDALGLGSFAGAWWTKEDDIHVSE
jgi:hypothetical protein